MNNDHMRQTVDRLLGGIVCLEWAIAAQDPWSELELRVRDMKKIAEQALASEGQAQPAEPVQPADTPEEFNAQSFFSLWSSYCDKKMEIEDLKVINEQLLEALKGLYDVVIEKNRAGADWGGLMGRLLAALANSSSAIETAEAEKAKGGV